MQLKKVLLVDDDRASNFLNRLTLKANKISCPIDEAIDGADALDYLSRTAECPDVIFLDINMPVMDGFEFLKAYEKQDKCCNQAEIYMLTSSMRDEDRQAALSHKYVKGYLDKPLTAKDVDEIISHIGER